MSVAATGVDHYVDYAYLNSPSYREERPASAHLIAGSAIDNGAGVLGALGIYLDVGQTTPMVLVVKSHDGDLHRTLSVAELKEVFGFNRSQMAQLLDCSRPQLNKWIKGDQPQREEFCQKISQYSEWISSVDPDHLMFFGRLAKRFVNSNESVLDTLSKASDKESFLEVYSFLKPLIIELSGKMASKTDTSNGVHGIEVDLPING